MNDRAGLELKAKDAGYKARRPKEGKRVFAGCDTNGDSTAYTTYTYTIGASDAHSTDRSDAKDATYLNSIALRFADLNDGGTSVRITVEYLVCDYDANASTSNSHSSGTSYYIDASYTYTEATEEGKSDTITVTLPNSDDSPDAVTGAYLTFEREQAQAHRVQG